jgi:hypothetical protein
VVEPVTTGAGSIPRVARRKGTTRFADTGTWSQWRFLPGRGLCHWAKGARKARSQSVARWCRVDKVSSGSARSRRSRPQGGR